MKSPAESVLGQRTFLLYENLDVQANLEGTTASARLTAGLDHGGKIAGAVALSNLTAAAPALRGDISASMPTLAPFAAFVPTVANLDGAVDAKSRSAGTIAAPEITGNVDATRLQADLGQLGIELREGRVRARGGARRRIQAGGQRDVGQGPRRIRGRDERTRRGRGAASSARISSRRTFPPRM